ncbi:MAG: L,D-transpeptidase family protein, partial [Desulfobacterales bacterium]|nr:L,D-transpeptidase family protein [Desulfobacterales bacterium]
SYVLLRLNRRLQTESTAPSMGRLAFSMPNPFDVFPHDTPERQLFTRDSRAFSEGCVRIENAMALALHALRSVPEWTEARLREAIDALGEPQGGPAGAASGVRAVPAGLGRRCWPQVLRR